MKKQKNLAALLTPSWVVNFIGISLGVLITTATIVLSRYQASDLRQRIFEAQSSGQPTSAGSSFNSVSDYVANNHVLSVAPLFIVWACVGLVIYFFAMSIARSFGEVASLRDELNYVHVSRRSLIRDELQMLALRVLATVTWFIFIKVSVSIILPYALALANIASQNLTPLSAIYVVGAAAVIYVDVYLHAVFLRVIAFKPRLFED